MKSLKKNSAEKKEIVLCISKYNEIYFYEVNKAKITI